MERKWWTLLALCMATFMLLVDITVVNVALPSIQRDLNASLTSLQWVVDAYALSLSALILTAGSLADRLGRRKIFAGGVAIFTLASLACGLAGDPTVLAVARAVQGIGGAAMFATALALIAQEFQGAERGTAIAIWGSTVGFAVGVGPLLGGLLSEKLSWPWIFFVNVPIGVAVVALARLRMVEYRDPDADRVDTAGLATFSAALFLLVFALLRGNNEGWGSTVIVASLVGAVVLLGLFVAIERRQSRPMLDLGLFRSPAFAGVSIGTFALGSGMFGLILYISLYFQNELGYSPLQAGLRFVPFSAMVFVVPLVTRRLVARLPARVPLSGGLLLTAVGLLMMHGVTVSSHWTAILPGMLVAGVGVGFCNPAIGSTALAVVHPARSGMASGFNNTCRLAGVATGIAALGAIFQHDIATGLAQRLPNVPAGVADVVSSSGPHAALRAVPAADRLQVLDASRHAFTDAINSLFLAGSATVLVGALAAGLLIRARDLHGHGAPSPAAEGATAA